MVEHAQQRAKIYVAPKSASLGRVSIDSETPRTGDAQRRAKIYFTPKQPLKGAFRLDQTKQIH